MKWIIKLSKARFIIMFFIIFIACQALFMLIQPEFLKQAGVPSSLDLQPGFSYKTAYTQIAQYGEEGIRFYNYFQIVDIIFPLCYGLLFSSIITLIQRKAFEKYNRLLLLNILPLAGALFDLLENFGIFGMIRIYPADFETLACLTSVSGIIKFALIAISLLLIVSGIIYFIIACAGKNKA